MCGGMEAEKGCPVVEKEGRDTLLQTEGVPKGRVCQPVGRVQTMGRKIFSKGVLQVRTKAIFVRFSYRRQRGNGGKKRKVEGVGLDQFCYEGRVPFSSGGMKCTREITGQVSRN
jgi:hypothetical protein